MEEGMEQIRDAIFREDFELLKKLLTDKTPEFCSKALHSSFHHGHGWYNSSSVRKWNYTSNPPEPIPVDVKDKEAFETKIRGIVQIFLVRGADVNYIYKNFSTFSRVCVFHEPTVSVVKMMIDHGADLELKDFRGFLPIQWAFKSGDADKMNLFLDLGIDATEINRLNLLHDAAGTSIEIVKRLVQLGADVNKIKRGQRTAILCAVESQNLEIVKFLIECGANLSINSGTLETAVLQEDIKIVKVLLENGANANLGGWIFPLTGAIKYILDEQKCLEMVKLLLQFGANIDGRAEDLKSPICTASRRSEEIVKLLLDRGARQDDNALIRAIARQRYEIVKMLLERGYNPSCQGYLGYSGEYATKTALSWAVDCRNKELITLLLNYGAQVDGAIDEGGKTPLHFIAEDYSDHPEIVQTLLDHGADINKEYDGETALTIAFQRKKFFNGCKCLIEHMMLIKAQGLHVSEKNLNACEEFQYVNLGKYQKACEEEMEMLKSSKFEDSNLSHLDILSIKDVQKLTYLANNQDISKVFKSNDFKKQFPVYGEMIVDHFDKGFLRKQDFDLLKKFINYLSTRNHDKLPKLPSTFVHELFGYLTAEDVVAIKKL